MGNTILKLGRMCTSAPQDEELSPVIAAKDSEEVNPIRLHYKINSYLGQGAFGMVYAGVSKVNGKKVVLKCVNELRTPWHDKASNWKIVNLGATPRYLLPKEVQLLLTVRGISGVAQIQDYYKGPGDSCVMVLDRISDDALDLYDFTVYKNKTATLGEKTAMHIFQQVVTAINACYERGVIHGDLKDENITISPLSGKVSIIDFGSGFFRNESCNNNYHGTLAFNAPEFFSSKSLDAEKMTVWSLGLLLYSMIYGDIPFVGWEARKRRYYSSFFAQADGKLNKRKRSVTKARRNLFGSSPWMPSKKCKNLIWACLQLTPSDRIGLKDLQVLSKAVLESALSCSSSEDSKHGNNERSKVKPYKYSTDSWDTRWVSGLYLSGLSISLLSGIMHSTPKESVSIQNDSIPSLQCSNISSVKQEEDYEEINKTVNKEVQPSNDSTTIVQVCKSISYNADRKPWSMWTSTKTNRDEALSVDEFEYQCQIKSRQLSDLARKQGDICDQYPTQVQIRRYKVDSLTDFDFLYFEPSWNSKFWNLWNSLEKYFLQFECMESQMEETHWMTQLESINQCLVMIENIKATELEILDEEQHPPVEGVIHIGLQKEWIRLYNLRINCITQATLNPGVLRQPMPLENPRIIDEIEYGDKILQFGKQSRKISNEMINLEIRDKSKFSIQNDEENYEIAQNGVPYLRFGTKWNQTFHDICFKMDKLNNLIYLILTEEENWGLSAVIELSVLAMEDILEIKKMEVEFMRVEGLHPVLGILHIGLQNEYIRLHGLRTKWMMQSHPSDLEQVLRRVQQRTTAKAKN